MADRIRVLLIEDNDVFRQALELLLGLRDELEIVGADVDGVSAVERCRELSPHVVLVDYRLPGLDGVKVTERVRAACPDVAIVGLTAAAGEREVEGMLDAGAVAVVGKDEPLDVLVAAVLDAAGSAATS